MRYNNIEGRYMTSSEERMACEAGIKEHYHERNMFALIFLGIIVVVLAFSIGLGMGSGFGADAALRREHCEQAGGQIQPKDGKCTKITVVPVEPK